MLFDIDFCMGKLRLPTDTILEEFLNKKLITSSTALIKVTHIEDTH